MTDDAGFRAACQLALDYLNTSMPLTFWSVTRVENGRQTHLYVDPNDFGLTVGDSTPWEATFCVHMVAGTAPRIAWDVSRVPVLATSPMARTTEIGAYAGAPILEGDGSLFGAICGVDRVPREDLAEFGPTLNVLAQLLTARPAE